MKPVDKKAIASLADGMKGVITAEEHSLIGGLASLVSEILQGRSIAMKAIGINDRFGQSAHSYDDLLRTYGLTPAHIAEAARRLC
jgi:transketolase